MRNKAELHSMNDKMSDREPNKSHVNRIAGKTKAMSVEIQ